VTQTARKHDPLGKKKKKKKKAGAGPPKVCEKGRAVRPKLSKPANTKHEKNQNTCVEKA